MKFDDLIEESEKDFDIGYNNLKDKVFLAPKLHNKYLRYWFKSKKKLNLYKQELDKIYKEKYHEYSHNFNYELTSKEVQIYILGDEDYQSVSSKYQNQKVIVDFLEECVNKSKFLTNDIKNIQNYLNYMQGV